MQNVNGKTHDEAVDRIFSFPRVWHSAASKANGMVPEEEIFLLASQRTNRPVDWLLVDRLYCLVDWE